MLLAADRFAISWWIKGRKRAPGMKMNHLTGAAKSLNPFCETNREKADKPPL